MSPETLLRGVDCGAVTLVESADGKVLLIRRPETLRTFPGIWVPPGGHVEEGETVGVYNSLEIKQLYSHSLIESSLGKVCEIV